MLSGTGGWFEGGWKNLAAEAKRVGAASSEMRKIDSIDDLNAFTGDF